MPRTKKLIPGIAREIPPELKLPEKLAHKPVTAKAISSGRFQKAILAYYAPQIVVKAVQSLIQALDGHDDNAARKQAFELYEMLQNKNNVSIINDLRQVNVDARAGGEGGSGDRRSLAGLSRQLAELRERRQALPGPATPVIDLTMAEPTPERETTTG